MTGEPLQREKDDLRPSTWWFQSCQMKALIKQHFDVGIGWPRSVSTSAGQRWKQLMDHVGQVYKTRLASDALTRLNVEIDVRPNSTRLESRVASMLLAALPISLKVEVVAARKLTAGAIILEVLKRYQPGGLSEKSLGGFHGEECPGKGAAGVVPHSNVATSARPGRQPSKAL